MNNYYFIKFLKSFWLSFKQALASNEEIRKIKDKHPRTLGFLKGRLDKTKFRGFPLTIFGLAFLYILLLFLGAVEDFITSDIIVSADVRVNTLLYSFRNIVAVKTFIWVTLLGESPIIIIFGLIVTVFLFLVRQKWSIFTLWFTIIGSETFTYLSKIVFHRPRPVNAVLLEGSASFPSGHATIAVAFYGFLVYLSLRRLKKKRYRLFAMLSGVFVILAIGFSRLYLGVHYISDVWTGYLVGLLWLIIGISLTEWKIFQDRHASIEGKSASDYYNRLAKFGLVAAAVIFYIIYGLSYQPKVTLTLASPAPSAIKSLSGIFTDFSLPHYTETIVGKLQEPVSLVIVAPDDAALVKDFKAIGWSLAETIDFRSTVKLFDSAAWNESYPTAPMTPSFWNKQVHDFGFEKSTGSQSVRQRHHARFWKTNLITAQGENVYVGTVSLDTGIKWMITHQISPDIDTERELVFSDLQAAGLIRNSEKRKTVDPVLGKNFTGDLFFTDGEAYFITLR